MPRPDGVVLDSLEELTARTRAVARVLLDAAAGDESLSLPVYFGESYATMLRTLTGPVRQLADLRSAPPDRTTWLAPPAARTTWNAKPRSSPEALATRTPPVT